MLTSQELFEKMTSDNEDVTISEIMVEFAKIHVETALREAHQGAKSTFDGRCWSNVYDTGFLLKSYPSHRIK